MQLVEYQWEIPSMIHTNSTVGLTPWYENYRDDFVQLMKQCHHEYIRHYMGCILVHELILHVRGHVSSCSSSSSLGDLLELQSQHYCILCSVIVALTALPIEYHAIVALTRIQCNSSSNRSPHRIHHNSRSTITLYPIGDLVELLSI